MTFEPPSDVEMHKRELFMSTTKRAGRAVRGRDRDGAAHHLPRRVSVGGPEGRPREAEPLVLPTHGQPPNGDALGAEGARPRTHSSHPRTQAPLQPVPSWLLTPLTRRAQVRGGPTAREETAAPAPAAAGGAKGVKAALGAAQQRITALEAQVAQLVEKLEQVNALAARVTELECKVESADANGEKD